MSDSKEDFYIIFWSTEDIKDIKIENIDLITALQSEANANIGIVKLEDIKRMKTYKLRQLLEDLPKKSALLVCSTEEKLDDLDFWKLGYVMGKMSIGEGGNKRIIGYVREDENKFYNNNIKDLVSPCDTEIDVKSQMKSLFRSMGIETKFDVEEFKSASKASIEKKVL